MKKELKEAIKILKSDAEWNGNEKQFLILENYIDNSISKEVIENKIEKYKEEGFEYEGRVCTMYYKREDEIDTLQELLEGK